MHGRERPDGAEAKTWGWNLEICRHLYQRHDGSLAVQTRIVRAFIVAGGYSSVHKHEQQHNIFHVVSGKLLVQGFMPPPSASYPPRVWSSFMLTADSHPEVFRAGELHQFQAITDVMLVEIYTATKEGDADSHDIVRLSENGVHQPGVAIVVPSGQWVIEPGSVELP